MSTAGPALAAERTRLRLRVRGAVQGVGFRPYVHGLATRHRLGGFVANDAEGVVIEVEGENVVSFVEALPRQAPPLARIDDIAVETIATEASADFRIGESVGGRVTTRIVPDAATCPECLAELFDPDSRFHRYPFVNCTHCGPRFTIAERLPYDRATTAMKRFPMCQACRADYDDPRGRRFHAEAISCPDCGPRLSHDVDEIAAALAAGKIVAIKGLGGYQLLCDARHERVVQRLRARKQRDGKPFAVMLSSVEAAGEIADLDAAERGLLEQVARPIVLLRSRDRLALSVAPGLTKVGVMLPVAPLHHLIFDALRGHGGSTAWALVCTSANPSGEPLLTDNDQALAALADIADLIVTHDRDIVIRADDSVVTLMAGGPRFIRRARGYVPEPIRLPCALPPLLAVGAHLKSTVTVIRGDEAFVSQHLGDLDTAAAIRFFEESIAHLTSILDVAPVAIAHDLHPDMASTRFAQAKGLPSFAVQHHHAHAASVVAEHGLRTPALALVLDGYGYGSDGSAWGGELLLCDGAKFQRLGHLAPLKMPGGDRAAREPWRMASAVLHDLGRDAEITLRFVDQPQARHLPMLLDRADTAATTSAGRLFDAVAGLLGVSTRQSYEGEAAMKLEALVRTTAVLERGWTIADGVLSLRPLLAQLIARDGDVVEAAGLFHGTLAAACVDWITSASRATGANTVVLSGGCFLNAHLAELIVGGCQAARIDAWLPHRLPANDGGLSLGQAWVAGLQMIEQDNTAGGIV
ncbi:carbamoyl phosphate phosphatase [NiFe] Hydrogenase maturation protein [Bradyrhizobium sp. ORS 285]|uniref:carbamoyltransferase HypF n=1 Tax=Bradyrhizobium sp. ORS 285 TaxID=115808 RepID=UPI0002405710|nr:carbamoyltransferase HypF [Bradyrhizobium sp. ORS 285]CCD88854.1 carbamoyl phosphate phosphatase, (NiFe) Hydrogenase maturation protein [Bradyrhizobium sp. ORS 285]SMX56757.1 carbamoyl phosphate phosphatase [NiFe] Hydrogenase maturation protein [Bradyrhizobium sp. ORS 285]